MSTHHARQETTLKHCNCINAQPTSLKRLCSTLSLLNNAKPFTPASRAIVCASTPLSNSCPAKHLCYPGCPMMAQLKLNVQLAATWQQGQSLALCKSAGKPSRYVSAIAVLLQCYCSAIAVLLQCYCSVILPHETASLMLVCGASSLTDRCCRQSTIMAASTLCKAIKWLPASTNSMTSLVLLSVE